MLRSVPPNEELSPAEQAEALAMIRGGLGEVELKLIGSMATPIFWVMRDRSDSGNRLMKSGSLFFLNAGEGTFAVTAAHVVAECLKDSQSPDYVQCMVGREDKTAFPFDLRERVIAIHEGIDIATLRFSADEVSLIGRTVLTGFQETWPPRLAKTDSFVTYCGWPGNGRRWLAPRDISFGIVAMAGKVTSSHETCISIQIERENLERVLGDHDMPENYDFGGMSGGPMLAIVQGTVLRWWRLAGVIFQGPNTSGNPEESIAGLEIIRARPAHFIKANGTLDIDRWEQSELPSRG
jgi:hypothetical protein